MRQAVGKKNVAAQKKVGGFKLLGGRGRATQHTKRKTSKLNSQRPASSFFRFAWAFAWHTAMDALGMRSC